MKQGLRIPNENLHNGCLGKISVGRQDKNETHPRQLSYINIALQHFTFTENM